MAKQSSPDPKPDNQPDAVPFETALERLESIVKEMEAGELPLEKTMQHFEEGMGLVKQCDKRLHEVERKIELLTKEGDQVTAEPFDEDSAAD